MNQQQVIEEAILALAPLASSRPRFHFVFCAEVDDTQGVFETILGMGGKIRAALYEKEGVPPYVITTVTLMKDGVEVECQRSRLANEKDRPKETPTPHHSFFKCADL